MKLINLERKTAKIKFSVEELMIFSNSLSEVYKRFTNHDFKALMQGISKNDSIEFEKSIENIIFYYLLDNKICPKSNFISLLERNKDANNIVVQLSYESLISLRSVLNVLVNNVCVVENFSKNIGFDKQEVSLLLDSMHFGVIKKMQERKPEFIIHKRSGTILKELDFKFENLEIESLTPRIKNRCIIISNNHQFSFLLVSIKNRRVSSGIQISIKEISNQIIIAQSYPQLIDNSDLIRFISYLELFVESSIDKDNFLNYTLPTLNSKLKPLFDIQIDSNYTQYLDNELLGIYFKLYIDHQDYEINDSINISEIDSFIQSVKGFLSALLKNQNKDI